MKKVREFQIVKQMVALTDVMRECLGVGDLTGFGRLLREGWHMKRHVASKKSEKSWVCRN